jgi:ABC-type bacteriocin/lantibiotic exporter with double-glycine peptidase domain
MRVNSSRAALFRKIRRRIRGNFGHFWWGGNQLARESVSYSRTARAGKFQASIRFPHTLETLQMVITAAHIQPIVALIAGILILIMPRLLNLIVAIYLICVGLIGLGVLKWLHM